MVEALNEASTLEEARLLKFFEDAMILAREGSRGAVERDAQLEELAAFAGETFVGKTVLIRPVIPKDRPITAWCYATPYPIAGTPGYRPQHGLALRRNPSRAIGTIDKLNLEQSTITVKPRTFSPYRLDRGLFLVNVLTDSSQSRVHIHFPDQDK